MVRPWLWAFALLLSCDRQREPDAAVAVQVSRAVVDEATVPRCVLAYTCWLSHPGLGSGSQSSSVDFATCTKTVSSESGPYESEPTPIADASTSSKKSSAL